MHCLMDLLGVSASDFWPGFWVNVVTLPFAIALAFLTLWVTRRLEKRDQRRSDRRRQEALLHTVRRESELNLKHVTGARESAERPVPGFGPLILGHDAWESSRPEIVALANLEDEKYRSFIEDIALSHAWSSSAQGFMSLSLQHSALMPLDERGSRDSLLENLRTTLREAQDHVRRSLESLDAYAQGLS